jgi:hypothetical protein
LTNLTMLTAESLSLPLIALHISPRAEYQPKAYSPLPICVQRRMLEQSSSMRSMDSEACVFPSQELVELETVFHCLVIDVRVKTFESNDMSVIS